MLKAEIEGEGITSKGVPQGGLLSTLLSNIVLNDLGHWELFPLTKPSNQELAKGLPKYGLF
ncbi:hypothetical protein GCM10008018_70790 [Paenibacillus marchantiophytorum]|uniref:Reverse transcriptase domain-containing protein n=1 Tax=Paenibacillus marchantiophytorum TaxID=1619310 RepID=A0ABQ1FIH4_9BACL|nr:hypothetical protein GCM10008018_70790 [Paenibacillus marchantiophytorum]